MCGSPRHKFRTASLDNAPRIDGFVFAPPDRSILIQPSEVTRFASVSNWLCVATFSDPGPPQRERPDAPVPSARCCCLLRSHPSSPRTRHPPFGLRHPPSATRHPPLFRRHPLDARCSVSESAGPIPRQSGPPDPAWAKLLLRQDKSSPTGNHGTLSGDTNSDPLPPVLIPTPIMPSCYRLSTPLSGSFLVFTSVSRWVCSGATFVNLDRINPLLRFSRSR